MERSSSTHHRRCRLNDDFGLEMIEYALIATLLLGGIFVIIPQFVGDFTNAYTAIIDALNTAMGG